MQRNVLLKLLLACFVFSLASSTNILDLIYWDVEKPNVEKRDDNVDTSGDKTCYCDGPSCMCCVDFNMTLIDLGGPGCVSMKYLSQADGLMVNVSYGDNLLHSEQVKGPDPEPTCIVLLANFAEVCARFSSLESHYDGLKGCLLLEPKLLNDIQTQFNIGCFTMGPNGMKLDEAATATQNIHIKNGTENETSGFNEEELLAVVNESAQKGLAFFEDLLGMHFGSSHDENKTDTTESKTVPK